MAKMRGPIPVKVIRRPPNTNGLVSLSCGADPETQGYRIAYRGTAEQVTACLESILHEMWKLRASGEEPGITE